MEIYGSLNAYKSVRENLEKPLIFFQRIFDKYKFQINILERKFLHASIIFSNRWFISVAAIGIFNVQLYNLLLDPCVLSTGLAPLY